LAAVSSGEWLALLLLSVLLGLRWPAFFAPALLLLSASLVPAVVYGLRAEMARPFASGSHRLLLVVLAFLQPLARGIPRRFTWLRGKPVPPCPGVSTEACTTKATSSREGVALWSESGTERLELLDRIQSVLAENRYAYALDSGWDDWDIHVFAGPWWNVRLRTLTEVYPQGKRLLRVGIFLRPSPLAVLAWTFGLFAAIAGLAAFGRPALLCLLGAAPALLLWVREGLRVRRRIAELADRAGQRLGLVLVPWLPFGSRPGSSFDSPREKE
ncbi:MAG: hypothetical protein PHP75_02560, partial [Methylacidiphilaceae bacterium]|nr:hypothetical protein [Candidatus Methylacidiphilaceae bacterium]